MEKTKENKFQIGELVSYNFGDIIGAQPKVGVIANLKTSTLYGYIYLVRWASGDEDVYAERNLMGVG